MLKKVMIVVGAAAVVFFGTVGAVMYSSYSPGAPSYQPAAAVQAMTLPLRMRTPDEHDAVRAMNREPYVLELQNRNGAVVFYGARHTSDPKDPQQLDIERRWNAFNPTVALYEGRQRNFYDTKLLDFLKGRSEAETLHQLAIRDGVRIYTLEPSYEDEVAPVVAAYGKERTAMYFTLRGYFSEAGGRMDESLAQDLLTKRTNTPALRGSLVTLADLDRVWRHEHPALEWRTLKSEPRDSVFHQMSLLSRKVRGEHIARTIIDLTSRGERVFAVVGSGHVIRLEWMLRAASNAPPAPDQHLAVY